MPQMPQMPQNPSLTAEQYRLLQQQAQQTRMQHQNFPQLVKTKPKNKQTKKNLASYFTFRFLATKTKCPTTIQPPKICL